MTRRQITHVLPKSGSVPSWWVSSRTQVCTGSCFRRRLVPSDSASRIWCTSRHSRAERAYSVENSTWLIVLIQDSNVDRIVPGYPFDRQRWTRVSRRRSLQKMNLTGKDTENGNDNTNWDFTKWTYFMLSHSSYPYLLRKKGKRKYTTWFQWETSLISDDVDLCYPY